MFGFPDINGFYDQLYGTAGVDFQALTLLFFGGASGIVFTGNPPYGVTDFLNIYPKFFGPPTILTGDIVQGSNVINNVIIAGLQRGQLLVNTSNFNPDCLIMDVGSNSITVSQPSLNTQIGSNFTVYISPFLPLIVISTYTLLALASLMKQRYQEAWYVCMAYFIAHYCTMFLRTESGEQNISASQVASSGLTKGIIINRTAGDVSATSKIIEGYEEWGAWRETQYGELFITMARAINCGPIWVR